MLGSQTGKAKTCHVETTHYRGLPPKLELFKGSNTFTCGEISSPPCLLSIVSHFTKLCFSFAIFSFVCPHHHHHPHGFSPMGCIACHWHFSRDRENVAESSKQCIFMVVGKPHQDKAVKMAGRKPPGYACCFFLKKNYYIYTVYQYGCLHVGSHQLVKINIHGVVQFFIGSDNWIHSYFVMPFYVC